MKILLAALILVCSSNSLFAGGSIDLADIRPLLEQQPKLWHFYLEHFDILPHGGGLRLGAPGIPLRGARAAPYEFSAKIKGDSGVYDLRIIINADIYFFDAQGKPTTDEMQSISKKEVLTSIAVGPLQIPEPK